LERPIKIISIIVLKSFFPRILGKYFGLEFLLQIKEAILMFPFL
jgi:hypothetical protein